MLRRERWARRYPACGAASTGAPAGSLQRCSACKRVSYCSVRCQRKHYPAHKLLCAEYAELRKAKEELAAEQEAVRQRLAMLARVDAAAAPAEDGEVVHLDVGGSRFTTLRSTLTADPDSFFAVMLSGRHAHSFMCVCAG